MTFDQTPIMHTDPGDPPAPTGGGEIAPVYLEHRVSAQDGAMLYFREYGPQNCASTPVVCLPGLTRNSKDFDALARRLMTRRRVIAIDMRGRGRSQWGLDFKTYRVFTEVGDILSLLAAAGIHRAVFIGTSRGGLQAAALSAVRPTILAGAILNDIGPEIDPKGVTRIAGYVGQPLRYTSWDEATAALREAEEPFITNYTDADWERYARRLFVERGGVITIDYDYALGKSLALDIKSQASIGSLWPYFRGLARVPSLLVRGEHSDLLSVETVKRMVDDISGMAAITVAHRGHAPFLDEPEALAAIDELLESVP